ncbi:MAG: ribonuclease D [Holosporales bacterium]
MQLITTTDDLVTFCQRLGATETGPDAFITVDTEFMREQTFWSQLCLIQVAGSEEAALIDPLAPGLDLTPFLDLLYAAAPLKVLHAARQDLEIFYNMTGQVPQAIFDTQAAALVLGFGESVAYETLVRQFTHHKLDKGQRFTDWSVRPLTDAQIRYALDDVVPLRLVYQSMLRLLRQKQRETWFDTELDILKRATTYALHPENAWTRLKVGNRPPRILARIQALAEAREREAQAQNKPRGRILKDEALIELALHGVDTPESLKQNSRLLRRLAGVKVPSFTFMAIAAADALGENQLPAVPGRPAQLRVSNAVMEILKLWLRTCSGRLGVVERLIATSHDLELLAADGPNAATHVLEGWRYDVFGREALQLIQGDVAMTVKGGKVTLVELS